MIGFWILDYLIQPWLLKEKAASVDASAAFSFVKYG